MGSDSGTRGQDNLNERAAAAVKEARDSKNVYMNSMAGHPTSRERTMQRQVSNTPNLELAPKT